MLWFGIASGPTAFNEVGGAKFKADDIEASAHPVETFAAG
jgi:hypothetical protein